MAGQSEHRPFWIFQCFQCGWRRTVTFHLTRCPRCDEPEAPF